MIILLVKKYQYLNPHNFLGHNRNSKKNSNVMCNLKKKTQRK